MGSPAVHRVDVRYAPASLHILKRPAFRHQQATDVGPLFADVGATTSEADRSGDGPTAAFVTAQEGEMHVSLLNCKCLTQASMKT